MMMEKLVVPNCPLEEMFQIGHYNGRDPNINEENFPLPSELRAVRRLEVTPRLIHYGRSMSFDDVWLELSRHRLHPVNLWTGLAFGAAYPHALKHPIAILDANWPAWIGGRVVPFLYQWHGRRCAALNWRGVWSEAFRFLAVPA